MPEEPSAVPYFKDERSRGRYVIRETFADSRYPFMRFQAGYLVSEIRPGVGSVSLFRILAVSATENGVIEQADARS